MKSPTSRGRIAAKYFGETIGELGAGMGRTVRNQPFMGGIERQPIDKTVQHCFVLGIQGSMNPVRPKH